MNTVTLTAGICIALSLGGCSAESAGESTDAILEGVFSVLETEIVDESNEPVSTEPDAEGETSVEPNEATDALVGGIFSFIEDGVETVTSSDEDVVDGAIAFPSTGEGSQGNNPGVVPTVIAELESMDVIDVDAMRGHKIFAGNELRNFVSASFVEQEYFNLDFPCTGEGVFEAYPAPQFQDFTSLVIGTFDWGVASATDTNDSITIETTGIVFGDEEHGLANDSFPVRPIVNGSLIKGTAVVESLVVSRIVQYDTCE